MAIKAVVAHRADPNNIGDIASNPLQYFLPRDEYEILDVANLGQKTWDENLPLIVGGGGLIGNSFMGDFYREMLQSPDKMQLERLANDSWGISNHKYKELWQDFNNQFYPLIRKTIEQIDDISAPRFVWGAGHNNSDGELEWHQIKWPKALAQYEKVGIRDFHPNSRFDWTPCASCMHGAFDKKYEIKNDIIWFEHKKQLIKSTDFGNHPIPRFVNSGNNLEQTIELLGSANTILTNSFHGAYWGILLNKKVIVVNPWSTKFKWFKHQPGKVAGKKIDWEELIDTTITHPDALEDCREATIKYWNEIKQSL